MATLQSFGEKYGALDDEIEAGIERLIGKLLTETGRGRGRKIAKSDLVEAFTRTRHARPIDIVSIHRICHPRLNEFGLRLGLNQWNNAPVRRDILDDIVQAIHERALVGIHGRGGCGKSVMLWQILNSYNRLFHYDLASNVNDSWVIDVVNDWRNIPPRRHPDETAPIALQRLKIANPNLEKPLIWLALDGLDENVSLIDQKLRIQRILKWFWDMDLEARASMESPPATLLVTCRRAEQISEWLDLVYGYPGEMPKSFPLDYFSANEVREALRRSFPDLFDRHGTADVDEAPRSLEDHDWFSPTPSVGEQDAIEPEVFQTLRHPVMWRALLHLADEDESRRALRGDEEATRSWAAAYIQLLFGKLKRRKPWLGLTMSELEELLQVVALGSQGQLYTRKFDKWIRPMRDTGLVGPQTANELYNEARSGGLIAQDERNNWRWQHELVRDYLVEVR